MQHKHILRQPRHTLRVSPRNALVLAATLVLSSIAAAQTPVTLYNNFTGPMNYTVIGGSLRTRANTDNPCTVGTSSSSALSIPSGSTILAAYLYYAGSSGAAGTPDWSVTLNGNTVNATRQFTAVYDPTGYNLPYFGGFADVTSIVAATGSGTYTFSGLTVNTGAPHCAVQAVLAGWAVVVVYQNASEYRHSINIYDGFDFFRGSQIIFSPSNFYVPYSRLDGKLTHITWEGEVENSTDLNGYSEDLGFNGQILADSFNPIHNQFNSASSALSSSATYGVDIDTYDISPYLSGGDTTATSVYSSGGDLVILNCEVISIADTASSDVQITMANSAGTSIVAGNPLTYTLTVRNNGPDTTGTITVATSLPSGAKFASYSGSGWVVDSTARPVYVFRHYGAHPPNITLPSINITVGVVYNASSYPTMTNTATVSSPQFDRRPWNNSASNQITVLTPVLVTSTKSFVGVNGTSPVAGDTLLYTIKVKNTGNYAVNKATYNNPVAVIDSVPAGFTIVPGSVWRGGTVSGQVITFTTIDNLAIGATDSVRYRVKAGPSFTGDNPFTNIAHIRSSTVDQTISATVAPPPLLSITKIAEPGKTKRRDTLTYTIIVKNLSSLTSSTNTIIRDTLTSIYLTYVTGSATKSGTYTAGPPRVLTWSRGTLTPGGMDTVSFKVVISNPPQLPWTVSNTAKVVNSQRSADSSIASIVVAASATGRITGSSSIASGETVYYTLVDGDLNTNTTSAQTITLVAVDTVTRERESILFSETGVNTGIFAGSIATVYGASSDGNNNGRLAVKPGDSLYISYLDAADSAGNTNQLRTWWTKVTGGNTGTLIATAFVLPGGSVNYTLTDADLNNNPSLIETYVLRDSCVRTGELENVTFTETGVTTGVFIANIATVFGTTSNGNNNGSFRVQAGDTLVLAYRDTVNSLGQSGGWLYARTALLGGQTATLSASALIRVGDPIQVTVTDNDLNKNPSVAESYTVIDSNMVTREKERVTIVETGPNTGVFVGTVSTQYGLVPGANNDGFFYVKQNDSLRVTYVDTLQANGGPGSIYTRTTKALGGYPATLSVSPTSILPGDSVTVTLADRDLNFSTTVQESYQVRQYNATTNEYEMVTITERSASDSVFIGKKPTRFGTTAGANNDGIFNVQAGDSLIVTYRDTVTTNGVPGSTLNAGTKVRGGVTGTLSATQYIFPRDTVFVTLTDANLNKNTTVAEAYVLRDTSSTGESESLTFTETGVNTGIFKAKIPTIFGTSAGANNDGRFTVQAGVTLTVVYVDSLNAQGGRNTVLATTTVNGGATATITASPTVVAANDSALVTLTDADLNKNAGAAEAYNLTLVSSTGESELMTFTETGLNTGIFTKQAPTLAGTTPGPNNDGRFTVQSADSITATYRDSVTATGDTATIRVRFKIGNVVFSTSLKSAVDLNGGSPVPLDTLAYAIRVRNTGTARATSVSVIDSLPANLTVLSGSITGGGTLSGRVLTFPLFNLAAGDSTVLGYSVRIDTTIQNGVPAVNTAHIRANGIDTKLTASFTPVKVPAFTLTKSVDKASAGPGDTLTYTQRYRNVGSAQAGGVAIIDTIPSTSAFVDFVSATGSASYNSATRIVTWPIGVVNIGDSASVSLKILIKKPIALNGITQVVNSAILLATGISPVSSNMVTTTVVYPQPAINKSVDSAAVYAGNVLTYTLIVSNTGATDATTSVLQDAIPTGTSYVLGSTKLNRLPVTDVNGTSALVAGLSLGTISPTTKDTVLFKVQVNSNVANNTVISNSASLTTDKLTGSTASNVVQSTVKAYARLILRKTASTSGDTPGSTITYTLRYGNAGSGAPISMTVVDTIPANTSVVSNSWTGTGISYANNIISIANPSVAAGDTNQTASFRVLVNTSLVPGTLTISNRATASSSDVTSVIDSALVTINVAAIQLTKSGPTGERIMWGPSTSSQSDTLVYTISYSVSGAGSLSGVALVDTLQSGLTYISSTGGGSAVGQVVRWNLGTLNSGATGQVTLKVETVTPGVYNNKARGTSSIDPVGAMSNTIQTTEVAGPIMNITKTASTLTPRPGDIITYTTTYRNVGGSDATAVVLVDFIPTQTTFYGTTVIVDGVQKTVNESGSGVTLTSEILTITIGVVKTTDGAKTVTYQLQVK